MFHRNPDSLDKAGTVCVLCGSSAAPILEPAQHCPGDMGTDLLLARGSQDHDVFRIVAGLLQPYVRCTGDGFTLICRPDDPLWPTLHETRPEAVFTFGGRCILRHPHRMSAFQHLCATEPHGRWQISIPLCGEATGSFVAKAQPPPKASRDGEAFMLELTAAGPLKLRPQ